MCFYFPLFPLFIFCIILYCYISFSCSFFFSKQKTAYDGRIIDWSSDVCSSDLRAIARLASRVLDAEVVRDESGRLTAPVRAAIHGIRVVIERVAHARAGPAVAV